jgi:hypothetical protein
MQVDAYDFADQQFDIETLLMEEDILLAPAPAVEFIMFDTNQMVTAHNPNCATYVQTVQRTLNSETIVTMSGQSLVNAVIECQNTILEQYERVGSEELTEKLCNAVIDRHRVVCTHLKQNVDTYERYCNAVQNEPCEMYQDAYSVYQTFLATFNDAEIHMRNYLVFVLDEICKLSQSKKKRKGEHAKVLPKEATALLWVCCTIFML